MIVLKDISKTYRMGDVEVGALRGVSLTIEPGDFVAIMGPSGSGKSTLMHLIGLLDSPDSGSYELEGQEVSRLTQDELAVLRRDAVGFIFQQFNLLPRMSAWENVSLPLLYSERHLDMDRAKSLLDRVGLGDRALHKPNELSGGQQQRVAIARSLINHPRIILADEPTGNLDSASEKEIINILKELNESGITVVLVTHEEEIGREAKRLIRMKDGVIQSDERLRPVSSSTSKKKPRKDPFQKNPPMPPGIFSKLPDFVEHCRQGFRMLASNKVRTGLSMLGIMIGVAAVVAMLALGRGAQKSIETQLSSLGSNLLVLRPGAVSVGGVSMDAGSVTRLTIEDAANIKNQIRSVQEASPTVQGRSQVTYLDKNWSTQVLGTGISYAPMHAAVPAVGRFFTEEENSQRKRVAVLGLTVVRQLFGDEDPIGEMIKINKVGFQVIGILPEKGSNSFRDQDDMIVMPVLTAMHRLLGKEYVDSIDIQIASGSDLSAAKDEAMNFMLSTHKVSPSQQQGAFQIRNMADIQAALSQSSQTMSLLLACIAAISLIVGGIGIMNIMLVSVTERTREIGLRKAVGAERWDILGQFLAEATVVGVVGGLSGIVLGWSVTRLLSTLSGWATSVSLGSVLLSFFFSASIGIIFGIYPAKKASLLHPIEALRYE